MMWRPSPVLLVLAVLSSVGCGGQGCSCLAPIPGGFPAEQRTANAGQVRITQSGLAALAEDPQALISAATGGGPLTFDVPPSCGGNPAVCCPGGNPQVPCGPIVIDLMMHPGDAPRLELRPVEGRSQLAVTVRARVRTEMDIPVQIPLIGACGIAIDTSRGALPDIKLDVPLNFVQDTTAGTTRIEAGNVTVTQLTSDDVRLTGSFGCQAASLGIGFFIGTLTSTFSDAIRSAINDQLCKQCASGDVAECGSSFATACTDGVCQEGNQCLQELGASGRLLGEAVFGAMSPGTTGAADIYEVAGGYATTNGGGIALGLLGGMVPAGAVRDRCGPPATPPARVAIPQSTYFQGNTRPDTGDPYGLGVGIHESQLDRFAYAAYDGGLLCLTIGTRTVPLLTSDTFGLFLPSLANLAGGTTSPMAIGLRPQSPPVIVLGKNTFMDDGNGGQVVDEPLLDITFTGLELDFFAQVEDQYIRLFTLVADLHLPVGLQVDPTGSITPVLGELEGAFSNLHVKNAEALTETPAQLEAIFPMLLDLALPQLAGGLGSFDVPAVGGLQIKITDITAVDNDAFLAMYGTLTPAMARTVPVETAATLVGLAAPESDVLADPTRWRRALRPRATLRLGGSESDLEWSVRVDGGLWSAWSAAPERVVSSERFWLQAPHTIEVAARRRGDPRSADPTPVLLPASFVERASRADDAAAKAGFHGAPGEGGCNCATGGGGGLGFGALSLLVGLVLVRPRGRRARSSARSLRRLAALGLVLAAGSLPSCDCGAAAPCGSEVCDPTPLEPGAIGKWNAAARDGSRTVITTYDESRGDIVLGELASDASSIEWTVIDGVPDETPTHSPSTYRGGIDTPGPDVGAYTAVALANGKVIAAYQDRERKSLRFAREASAGKYLVHDVDVPRAGERIGAYASLAARPAGGMAIAYLVTGVAAAGGARATELRLALTANPQPDDNDWTISTVASVMTGCAALCGEGQQCVAPAADGDPEVCVTATSDCTPACANDEVCVTGECRAEVTAIADTTPGGLGFPTVLALPDGRIAVVYHDREATALMASVGPAGAPPTEVILDDDGDRGMWASAVAGADGTIHVVYQEARGDQVFYTTLGATPGTPELVDDGVRAGDRPHNVGAGAAIYLAGGAPHLVYQDALSHRLVSAIRGGGGWTHTELDSGALLDGFHVAVPADGGVIVSDALDKTLSPATTLATRPAP